MHKKKPTCPSGSGCSVYGKEMLSCAVVIFSALVKIVKQKCTSNDSELNGIQNFLLGSVRNEHCIIINIKSSLPKPYWLRYSGHPAVGPGSRFL